jgi:PAS domain S-box-containing protein
MPIPASSHAQRADLEHERLTSLINSMADGVLATNEHMKIVISNGAALNILDVNSSLIGKSIQDVLKITNKNNQPVDIHKVIHDTKTSFSSRDWRLVYPDGETINLYISIAPVRLSYGKEGARGHVLLLRDITREKSLEEERDEFISVVSHELRTPIAIAEGNISNAEFLFQKSGLENGVIADALKQAHAQTTFLSGLINDLSTLSRAERGKLTFDIESINVHDLIEELAANYEESASAKNLHIKTELDPHLELLQSGRLYVREILQNFITNAIKYTEEGHVTIGARHRQDGVEFFVSDTGIGISKSDREKVFDKFFRADNTKTRAASGTGLGLYVTTKLARLLHAEINLESEIGQGSTFTIFVPNLK